MRPVIEPDEESRVRWASRRLLRLDSDSGADLFVELLAVACVLVVAAFAFLFWGKR